MNRRAVVTGLVVFAVFAAGALAGATLVHLTSPLGGTPEARESAGSAPAGGGDRERARDRRPIYRLSQILDDELDLEAGQQRRVERILERRSEHAREMFRESHRRFRAHLDSTVAEIKGVLSAEQARRFQEDLDAMENRRREDRREER